MHRWTRRLTPLAVLAAALAGFAFASDAAQSQPPDKKSGDKGGKSPTVKVENEDSLRAYISSDWGERVFCAECGTSLFWRMRDGSETSVSMNAFDDVSGFVFTDEIFVDEKPANYDFANATHKMTGAEVIAAFSAQQGN